MPISLQITINTNTLEQLYGSLVSALASVHDSIATDAATLVRNHLRNLDETRPNRLGGMRTNFYGRFAKDVTAESSPAGAAIRIGDAGLGEKNVLAAKLFGIPQGIRPSGTVKSGPRTGQPVKMLTIPANAEAYGQRAGKFKLEFSMVAGRPALVKTADETGKYSTRFTETYTNKKGETKTRIVRKKKHGFGDVMFWLIRKTRPIPADRSVLPSDSEFIATMTSTISRRMERLTGGAS